VFQAHRYMCRSLCSFNLLYTPLQGNQSGFPGMLAVLSPHTDRAVSPDISVVTYGGNLTTDRLCPECDPVPCGDASLDSPPPEGSFAPCTFLSFVEHNFSQPITDAVYPNKSFTPLGGNFIPGTVVSDVAGLTLGTWQQEQPNIPPAYATVRRSVFAALVWETPLRAGQKPWLFGSPGWRLVFYAVINNSTQFLCFAPACFQPTHAWRITNDGQELPIWPIPQIATQQWQQNCSFQLLPYLQPTHIHNASHNGSVFPPLPPGTNGTLPPHIDLTDARWELTTNYWMYGGFFDVPPPPGTGMKVPGASSHCTLEQPLVFIAAGRYVSAFAYEPATNVTVDLHPSVNPAASMLDVCGGATECGSFVTDLSVFADETPDMRAEANYTQPASFNSETARAPFRDDDYRLSRDRMLWAAVSVQDPHSQTRLLTAALPEFSKPLPFRFQAQSPSLWNPAGLAKTTIQHGCQPVSTFDYLSGACVPRDIVQAPVDVPGRVVMVNTKWRSALPSLTSILRRTGCLPGDEACLETYINITGVASAMSQWVDSIPQAGDAKSASLTRSALALLSHAMTSRVPSALPAHAQYALTASQAVRGGFLPTPPSTAKGLAQMMWGALYGLRHIIFAATSSRMVLVVEATSFPSSEPLPVTALEQGRLAVDASNQFPMVGDVRSLVPTDNAQFLFAAVSREKWSVDSMERIVDICQQLALNPADPFLQQYSSACNPNGFAEDGSSLAPRRPGIADFLQVAAACMPGTYCPSFSEEIVDVLPDGEFSDFGFDRQTCSPGFYCKGGIRNECPTAFECPLEGMALPQPCPPDPTRSSTCFGTSPRIGPSLCPPGTLCGIPYMPAIGSPPGFVQNNLTNIFRSLEPCAEGEWCSLGRSLAEGPTLECPANTECPSTSILEPNVCTLGGRCTSASNCTMMPFCPAGTVHEEACPAGNFCPNETVKIACSLGTICESGSPVWRICPPSMYCPSSSESYPCPDGFYCPQGAVKPVPCGLLQRCVCPPKGCAEPADFTSILVVCVLPVIFYLVYQGALLWQRRRRAGRDEKVRLLRAAAQQRRQRRKQSGGLEMTENGGDLRTSLLASASAVRATSTSEYHPLHDNDDEEDDEEQGSSGKKIDYTSCASRMCQCLQVGGGRAIRFLRRREARMLIVGRQRTATAATGDGDDDDEEEGITRKMHTVDIRFEGLGLELPGGKKVLEGVTGQFRHGRLVAVMGPSGAGKSTLLTTLAGKAAYGKTLGRVFLNEMEAPGGLSEISHATGFVPQDDVMLRRLTVEENLRYAAFARLPATWSEEHKLMYAEGILELLGLSEIRHSLIGDESLRGISGGQRKRVSIAIEMCSDPTVLFLDEPTSGLDATSTFEVCTALRRIADLGLTIAAVVHQPRFEVFRAFHDVLLLGKGGRTVYLGPTSAVEAYFASPRLGLPCPRETNVADHAMDVIAGVVPPAFRTAHPDWHQSQLIEFWAEHGTTEIAGLIASGAVALEDGDIPPAAVHETTTGSSIQRAVVTPSGGGGSRASSIVGGGGAASAAPATVAVEPLSEMPPPRDYKNCCGLLWLLFRRAVILQVRRPELFFLDLVLVFIAALFLGLVYYGDPLFQPPQPREAFTGCPAQVATGCQLAVSIVNDQILGRGIMSLIAIGLTGSASFLRVFGNDRHVYWREASGLPQPSHTLAFFLSNDLARIPTLLLAPALYSIVFVTLTSPRAPLSEYFLISFAAYFTSTGLGYLVSILTPPSLAQLVGVVTVFSFAQFAGGAPTLPQLYTKVPPLCWLPWVSYVRYALEAQYTAEADQWKDLVTIQGVNMEQHVQDTFGFTLGAWPKDILIVLAFGLAFRILAAVTLWLKDRDKKL
jgi:ABC-type multidrug transport system ATPase subunit